MTPDDFTFGQFLAMMASGAIGSFVAAYVASWFSK